MDIERRLADLGLDLPPAMSSPPGTAIPFSWVRVIGDRALVSGHGAVDPDGAPSGPFGPVPSGVSLEQAQASARRATLAVLASLQVALGDLDRISAWVVVNGFVNADPGYARTTLVMNPCSELLLELFGPDAGSHARTAIGVAALPFDLPVVISAEVALHP
jgi:enamine deaminase RidA (YjgF/YER057c/UK114 family)